MDDFRSRQRPLSEAEDGAVQTLLALFPQYCRRSMSALVALHSRQFLSSPDRLLQCCMDFLLEDGDAALAAAMSTMTDFDVPDTSGNGAAVSASNPPPLNKDSSVWLTSFVDDVHGTASAVDAFPMSPPSDSKLSQATGASELETDMPEPMDTSPIQNKNDGIRFFEHSKHSQASTSAQEKNINSDLDSAAAAVSALSVKLPEDEDFDELLGPWDSTEDTAADSLCAASGPCCGDKTASQSQTPPGGDKTASQSQTLPDGDKTASQSQTLPGGDKTTSQSQTLPDGDKTASQSPTLPGGDKTASQSQTLPDGDKTASQSPTLPGGDKTASQSQTLPGGNKTASQSQTLLGGDKTTSQSQTLLGGDKTASQSQTLLGGDKTTSQSQTLLGGDETPSQSQTLPGGNKTASQSQTLLGGDKTTSQSQTLSGGDKTCSQTQHGLDKTASQTLDCGNKTSQTLSSLDKTCSQTLPGGDSVSSSQSLVLDKLSHKCKFDGDRLLTQGTWNGGLASSSNKVEGSVPSLSVTSVASTSGVRQDNKCKLMTANIAPGLLSHLNEDKAATVKKDAYRSVEPDESSCDSLPDIDFLRKSKSPRKTDWSVSVAPTENPVSPAVVKFPSPTHCQRRQASPISPDSQNSAGSDSSDLPDLPEGLTQTQSHITKMSKLTPSKLCHLSAETGKGILTPPKLTKAAFVTEGLAITAPSLFPASTASAFSATDTGVKLKAKLNSKLKAKPVLSPAKTWKLPQQTGPANRNYVLGIGEVDESLPSVSPPRRKRPNFNNEESGGFKKALLGSGKTASANPSQSRPCSSAGSGLKYLGKNSNNSATTTTATLPSQTLQDGIGAFKSQSGASCKVPLQRSSLSLGASITNKPSATCTSSSMPDERNNLQKRQDFLDAHILGLMEETSNLSADYRSDDPFRIHSQAPVKNLRPAYKSRLSAPLLPTTNAASSSTTTSNAASSSTATSSAASSSTATSGNTAGIAGLTGVARAVTKHPSSSTPHRPVGGTVSPALQVKSRTGLDLPCLAPRPLVKCASLPGSATVLQTAGVSASAPGTSRVNASRLYSHNPYSVITIVNSDHNAQDKASVKTTPAKKGKSFVKNKGKGKATPKVTTTQVAGATNPPSLTSYSLTGAGSSSTRNNQPPAQTLQVNAQDKKVTTTQVAGATNPPSHSWPVTSHSLTGAGSSSTKSNQPPAQTLPPPTSAVLSQGLAAMNVVPLRDTGAVAGASNNIRGGAGGRFEGVLGRALAFATKPSSGPLLKPASFLASSVPSLVDPADILLAPVAPPAAAAPQAPVVDVDSAHDDSQGSVVIVDETPGTAIDLDPWTENVLGPFRIEPPRDHNIPGPSRIEPPRDLNVPGPSRIAPPANPTGAAGRRDSSVDPEPPARHPGLDFAVDTVMEVFPGRGRAYITYLMESYLKTGTLDTALNQTMEALLDGPGVDMAGAPPAQPQAPAGAAAAAAAAVQPQAAEVTVVHIEQSPASSRDYYKDYKEMCTASRAYVADRLSMEFRNVRMDTINYVMQWYNNHYAPTHRCISRGLAAALDEQEKKKVNVTRMERWKPTVMDLKIYEGEQNEKKSQYPLMKGLRQHYSSRMHVGLPGLQEEVDFVEQRGKLDKEECDRKVAWSLLEAEYEEEGQSIECGCCFSEQPFENMVQCFDGHLFCCQCLLGYAREAIYGSGKLNLACMTDNCDSTFPKSQLVKALPQDVIAKYDERLAEENLNKAAMPDLVRCPKCNIAAILDNRVQNFKCPNSSCRKETCRNCKEDWGPHVGKRCDQMEKKDETSLRTGYEEKMTAFRVRICTSCHAQFYKDEGCNKMTCRCGNTMCYICRKPQISYKHFCQHPRDPGHGCKQCQNCSLWTNPDEDEKRAIAEMQKEAQEKRKEQGYLEDRVIGVPEKKQRTQ